jgi:hypothetical protein
MITNMLPSLIHITYSQMAKRTFFDNDENQQIAAHDLSED